MEKEVKIVNGDLEGVCMESSVATWEANGWTRADDGSSEAEADEPKAKTTKKG